MIRHKVCRITDDISSGLKLAGTKSACQSSLFQLNPEECVYTKEQVTVSFAITVFLTMFLEP